jgi:hypothetical protein
LARDIWRELYRLFVANESGRPEAVSGWSCFAHFVNGNSELVHAKDDNVFAVGRDLLRNEVTGSLNRRFFPGFFA